MYHPRVRNGLRLVAPLLLALGLGPAASAGAATSHSIVIQHATVTTAKKGRASAVRFTLTNDLRSTIWITSVSSPLASSDMIDFDPNMKVKTSHMVAAAYVEVRVGHTVTFSFEGQGAMLGSLHHALSAGATIPLTLGWHSTAHPSTVYRVFSALVVKPSQKIYFGGASNGSMPGMNMG